MGLLIIGYGNDLRCDDGAGRAVADRIEAMALPGVEVRSVQQLAPELTLDIACADTVVFVDASIDVAETTMVPAVPEPVSASATTHYNTPGSLLALTETVGRAPEHAVTISIPVTELCLGMELTPMTELAVADAITMVLDIVTHGARF